VQNEEQQPFVIDYYQKHPDELDLRPPAAKLEDVNAKLEDEELEVAQKRRLLAQKKQLTSFVYGDESPEMMQVEKESGKSYNKNGRPASAARHLSRAREIEKQHPDTDPNETAEIGVETAEAYLNMADPEKRQETLKNMKHAQQALRPTYDCEFEDTRLVYRRDIAMARVTVARGRYTNSLQYYDLAVESLKADSGETEELAELLVEVARAAGLAFDEESEQRYYQEAHDLYVKLGMTEQAKELEPFLPEEVEEPEPEEEEAAEGEAEPEQGEKRKPLGPLGQVADALADHVDSEDDEAGDRDAQDKAQGGLSVGLERIGTQLMDGMEQKGNQPEEVVQ
jgi:tetratricopeptide (TPR) repeat protein